ncbi:MAG: hypothetical protein JSS49_04620 [Planctomycetes bacterium]|nr:hypothetical protein [Planctomycetota bacterium]
MTFPDRIPYHRYLPWLHLFRAVEIAMSFRQLVVATLAVFCLWLGTWLASIVFHSPDDIVLPGGINFDSAGELSLPGEATQAPPGPWPFSRAVKSAEPWNAVVRSTVQSFRTPRSLTSRLSIAGELAWSVAVWSLFGLAICRLAARQFALKEAGSFRKAIQFGLSRWIHGVVAPLLPTGAAVVMLLLASLAAFPGRIPWLGSALAALLTPVVVACSLIAAFLLIAMVLGWPLMVAAIATDDCDGFGGLSRSYSLWTGRPWYFAWCWIVSAGAALVAMYLVNALAFWTLRAAEVAIQAGMGETEVTPLARLLAEDLCALAPRIYGLSLFWTCATITYMLLRQSVDSMPLDKIAPDDDERPARDPLPVVGMPAMQRETANPA